MFINVNRTLELFRKKPRIVCRFKIVISYSNSVL